MRAPEGIALDLGMKDGTCVFDCRQALLFYVLRKLGLDRSTQRSPKSQQIPQERGATSRLSAENDIPLNPNWILG